MRVLTVGNMYPPHSFGGYELVWRAAIEDLRSAGQEVRVLTTDTDTGTAEPDDPDVHRELRWRLRDGRFVEQGWRGTVALARHNHRVLQRHLDDLRPDVVAWWSMGGLSLSMIEEVRLRGIRAEAFVIDDWLDYGPKVDDWLTAFRGRHRRWLGGIATRLFGIPTTVDFDAAASYVFVSEFTRRRARSQGLGLQHTAVMPCGIHEEYLDERQPERPWAWELLYVGRLDPRKGVDAAVQALAALPAEARLTIAGGWDEEEEHRLRELAIELGCADRVTFAGQLDRRALIDAYDRCDVVLFPVRWDEPWGLVPLEAMARGRPVLATGRGGSGEYLRDEQNCLLIDVEDPSSPASAVRRLAAEPDLRARLRAGGLVTASQHTEARYNRAARAAIEGVAPTGAPEARPLRILHLGSGLRPMRRGGLVAYCEDVMEEQVRRGHDVSYLFAGRYFPGLAKPRLKRWSRRGVTLLEIISSPLHDHGFQPALEISEPQIERMLERILAERRPDVVHVQELAGLPFSVLDVARRAGVPTLMTLQDYYALWPTFKLLDAHGQTFLGREVGAACVEAVAADGRSPGLLYEATLGHYLHRFRAFGRLPAAVRRAALAALVGLDRQVSRRGADHRDPALYQRRRDLNVERLNRTDRLVAMSSRVAELYAAAGVEADRITTMQLTLSHIENLGPRVPSGQTPVTFATLGGGESEAKGALVLLEAAERIGDLARAGRFRLLIFGMVAPEVAATARRLPGVELAGRYAAAEQDAVLDGVDVGIVPSAWEEAYAYAGVEFLAKGIPVIANAIGGMPDYVREGETGWLNLGCDGPGLASIMREIVERPAQIVELNRKLVDTRAEFVTSMRAHADATEALYRELIEGSP